MVLTNLFHSASLVSCASLLDGNRYLGKNSIRTSVRRERITGFVYLESGILLDIASAVMQKLFLLDLR